MKRDDKTPQHYIDSVKGEQKELLLAIRAVILEVEPDSRETIEYGMLSYPELANLAAQKNYVSLYVAPDAIAAFQTKYPGTDCGKCCLRFTSIRQFDPSAVRSLLEQVRQIRQEGGDIGCCG